jgi:oligopeptide transport system permease protein
MALLILESEWGRDKMANYSAQYEAIDKEKFAFVNENERITDRKLEDKPIGYLKDAWIRFKKSRASVVAAIIILLIVLYAFLCPVLITNHTSTFLDTNYAKKPARVEALYNLGFNGSTTRDFSDKGLIQALSIGVAAEDWDGRGVSIAEAMDSDYMPIIEITNEKQTINAAKQEVTTYTAKIDNYLEVGFKYYLVEQSEYAKIREFEEETGLHVLYPLIENNEYTYDSTDANYWYKSSKNTPVSTADGKVKKLSYSEDLVLEDNYKRDADGNPIYYEYAGGGTAETAQYKIRVLYYTYFQYKNGGAKPDYILGTDSQGYDMALRLAGGIKLSLLLAISVSVINFIIGAAYGAVEGYYGGAVDLIMERISDILYDMPFIVVATLFQIHFSAKVGAVPCLIFAYILTGWISTASRVRTQFYRFKNQEYVMAARTLGAKDRRIIWKHIFPNTLGTIITSCALVIPGVILSESMLSFLGIVKLGSASATSLGTLLSDASGIWTNYPHLMLCPALVISLLMICFNLFSNGLRDAFNPALRGVEE